MKVLICGSRHYADLDAVTRFVKSLPLDTILIVGGAYGVDQVAEDEGRCRGLGIQRFVPDWRTHGKAAGPLRNSAMVDACDVGYAFWDGTSRGTADAIRKLKDAGKYREVT